MEFGDDEGREKSLLGNVRKGYKKRSPLRLLISPASEVDEDMYRSMEMKTPEESKTVNDDSEDVHLHVVHDSHHSPKGSINSLRPFESLSEYDFEAETAEDEHLVYVRIKQEDVHKLIFTRHVYNRHPLKRVMNQKEFEEFIKGIWVFFKGSESNQSNSKASNRSSIQRLSDYHLMYSFAHKKDDSSNSSMNAILLSFIALTVVIVFVSFLIWSLPNRHYYDPLLFTFSIIVAAIIALVLDAPTSASREDIEEFLDSCNEKYRHRAVYFSLEHPKQASGSLVRPTTISRQEEIVVCFTE